MRDSQKQRVYDAERCIQSLGATMEWDEVVAFVKKVEGSALVKRRYRHYSQIEVYKGRNGGMARSGGYVFDSYEGRYVLRNAHITLGVWARQPVVILHELAHHYAGLGKGHGWKFCETMLVLVKHFMGKEAHDKLKASYKQHRVKYTAPRPKRNLTEEQKQVLRDRLAAHRESKKEAVSV